ncbi:MAG TPA: rod shape-determining protein MreC [Bacteroidales bacterium]|nr:rod shape-determining protein MreC [Bacteroidales bacterium]
MRNILRFLAKYSTVLFFVLMQALSLYLLFNYNNFQQSALFSTANKLNGWIYSIEESVYGYFYLRENNESLLRENNELGIRIANLESALRNYTDSTKIPLLRMKESDEFSLISARVIQNSVTHYRNFITLNVGKMDGVKPEMGVANSDGIIGVVSLVSNYYSVVIPVLNRDQRFSCKLKNNNATGSLTWDGVDRRFAFLEEIPPYVAVSKGDTVVTSGFSAVFPEGLMVGTVDDYKISEDANYLRLKIRLSTRFDALSNVRVIRYKHREELKKLEGEAAL